MYSRCKFSNSINKFVVGDNLHISAYILHFLLCFSAAVSSWDAEIK